MDLEKKYLKRPNAPKRENYTAENKENFNCENQANNFKKPQIRNSKAILHSVRYYESKTERISYIKKEFDRSQENPQKKININNTNNIANKNLKELNSKTNLNNKNDNEKNKIKIQLDNNNLDHECLSLEEKNIKNDNLDKNNNIRVKKCNAKIKENDTKNILTENSKQNVTENLCINSNKGIILNNDNSNNNKNNTDNNLALVENLKVNFNNVDNIKCNPGCENLEGNKNNFDKNYNKNTNLVDKQQKKKIVTMNDYLDKENVILIRNYGIELYNYMRTNENINIPKDFMEKHKINTEIRTKMVDWMIEVLNVYKCEHETFFLSVFIMDSYIFKSEKIITTDDVHILGLTSMFIASKFEDVIPIRMSSLVSKIGHDIFTS